jgi:DNA-binding response OmpR family regulator
MAKILLVDDHPDIVRLLEISLKAEGHEIVTARNGVEALEAVNRDRPDLMILDVVMPELDGYRVLSRIRSSPALRDMVIVMLTVRDQPGDVALGLDLGADFYLSKPFRPTEITSLVRRVLGGEGVNGDQPGSSSPA